jgi:hypothetical protein
MACNNNIVIKQTLTYADPDTNNGLVQGTILLEIFNAGAASIDGTVTVDSIRSTPVIDLDDAPISESQPITSTGSTHNFNFYYPSTKPEFITINAKAKVRIDDCFYEISCNHVLQTPNISEDSSICSKQIQGYEVVSGCTNPLYYEYNPDANVDDGSCATLIPIQGCTNPLAINYNPYATKNDGSCIFKSGCTNPIAVNYDSTAIIDDFSCECGDVNIALDLGYTSGESFVVEDNCQYTIEFDLMTKINCEKFLEFFYNDTRTPIQILSDLSINTQIFGLFDVTGSNIVYTGGTVMPSGETEFVLLQSEEIYFFDINTKPFGIGTYGDGDSCETMYELISEELGLDCEPITSRDFEVSWKRYSIVVNSDLVEYFLKFNLNFSNFKFGLCAYIDNVKLTKICAIQRERCVLIPSRFGFEFERVLDNKKSWVKSDTKIQRKFNYNSTETNYFESDSRLIFNTKELELHLNPIKYIENDVFDYYSYNSKWFKAQESYYQSLNKAKVNTEYIDVVGRQFIREYPRLNAIYETYLDGIECANSKELNYGYGLTLIELAGANWFKLVEQLVPATSIWGGYEYIIKNNLFHKPKHKYQRYSLGVAANPDLITTGVTVECRSLNDKCLNEPFADIDGFLSFDFGNIQCENTITGGTIGFSGEGGDGFFRGRLVEYYVDENGNNIVDDYIGFDDYECLTGTTCELANVNPNLSYTCIVNPETNQNTGLAILHILPSGGIPPYTISGATDGQIVAHESVVNVVVTDSQGCESLEEYNSIQINCPQTFCDGSLVLDAYYVCNTNECGVSDGTAFLYFSISGGTPPYQVQDLLTFNYLNLSGEAVNNGDLFSLVAIDANGCTTKGVTEIKVDCEDCQSVLDELEFECLLVTTANGSNPASFDMNIGFPTTPFPMNIQATFTVTGDTGTITSGGNYTQTIPAGFPLIDDFQFVNNYGTDPVVETTFTFTLDIVLDNGCEFSKTFNITIDPTQFFDSVGESFFFNCV